ncbi:unnamed protein product [Ceutorhynchus assimilis]|uniref:Uncharacterized protein n=1 Tax=Ceutorhynchus assimilis TaxID=467358 RepID=A0A9N9QJ81_9CUCU|nr:unnamed protein product [Ceutorhynchus assimilis]
MNDNLRARAYSGVNELEPVAVATSGLNKNSSQTNSKTKINFSPGFVGPTLKGRNKRKGAGLTDTPEKDALEENKPSVETSRNQKEY